MLLDDALDLADLLQHSLVLGQRDLDVLLENPGRIMSTDFLIMLVIAIFARIITMKYNISFSK